MIKISLKSSEADEICKIICDKNLSNINNMNFKQKGILERHLFFDGKALDIKFQKNGEKFLLIIDYDCSSYDNIENIKKDIIKENRIKLLKTYIIYHSLVKKQKFIKLLFNCIRKNKDIKEFFESYKKTPKEIKKNIAKKITEESFHLTRENVDSLSNLELQFENLEHKELFFFYKDKKESFNFKAGTLLNLESNKQRQIIPVRRFKKNKQGKILYIDITYKNDIDKTIINTLEYLGQDNCAYKVHRSKQQTIKTAINMGKSIFPNSHIFSNVCLLFKYSDPNWSISDFPIIFQLFGFFESKLNKDNDFMPACKRTINNEFFNKKNIELIRNNFNLQENKLNEKQNSVIAFFINLNEINEINNDLLKLSKNIRKTLRSVEKLDNNIYKYIQISYDHKNIINETEKMFSICKQFLDEIKRKGNLKIIKNPLQIK